MSRYTHLLFDLDDTLLDFRMSSKKAFHQFYNHYLSEISMDVEYVYEHYHNANMMVWEMFEQGQLSIDELKVRRFEWMYLQAGLPVPYNDLETQSRFYLDALIDATEMINGASEVLQNVQKTHHISVITNGIREVQIRRIERLQISGFFEHLFISEEIGHSKPSKDFFDAVFNKIGNTPKNKVLVIGDSLKADIKGALNAGVHACWYNPFSVPLSEALKPNFQIQKLEELYTVLI